MEKNSYLNARAGVREFGSFDLELVCHMDQ